MLATKTEKEIIRINSYERKWKINTNKSKFKILSISKTKPYPIYIDDENIPYAKEVKILGLKITRTGTSSHLTNQLKQAKALKLKLKRFQNLRPKLKIHLYKALIQSIMEYPILPNAIMSKTTAKKWQQFQNGVIYDAIKNDPTLHNLSIEDLHGYFNLTPINLRFHRRANRVWDKLSIQNPELYEASNSENAINNPKDHYWWPRIGPYVETEEPDPLFKI